jgi:hypothetical protein
LFFLVGNIAPDKEKGQAATQDDRKDPVVEQHLPAVSMDQTRRFVTFQACRLSNTKRLMRPAPAAKGSSKLQTLAEDALSVGEAIPLSPKGQG